MLSCSNLTTPTSPADNEVHIIPHGNPDGRIYIEKEGGERVRRSLYDCNLSWCIRCALTFHSHILFRCGRRTATTLRSATTGDTAWTPTGEANAVQFVMATTAASLMFPSCTGTFRSNGASANQTQRRNAKPATIVSLPCIAVPGPIASRRQRPSSSMPRRFFRHRKGRETFSNQSRDGRPDFLTPTGTSSLTFTLLARMLSGPGASLVSGLRTMIHLVLSDASSLRSTSTASGRRR